MPVIDGKLDDEAWERSEPVSLEVGQGGRCGTLRHNCPFGLTSEDCFRAHLAEPTPDKLVRDIDSRDASGGE